MTEFIEQLPNAISAIGRSIIKSLTDSSTPLLAFIPKPSMCSQHFQCITDVIVKIILFLLFLINSSSWPFMWHIRVWYYPLKAYYDVYTKGQKKYLLDWKKKVDVAGGIRHLTVKTKRIASVDDCDYNMHLSNSYVPLS